LVKINNRKEKEIQERKKPKEKETVIEKEEGKGGS
jgi:hypothetical protein